ncbi:hypothetical protein PQQ51_33965 [Paraburkholderia xenovorans]|uniref:hypothetical protein n=1 Tax=Paraburkholderia xenovorans TaxID=36873 RepID=UPI0038BBC567
MLDRGEYSDMADALIVEISAAKSKALCNARRFELGVFACWWGALILAATASGLGLVSAVPAIKAALHLEPWMIGALSLGATGLEVVRRKTGWRAKSNAFYGFDQKCMQLLMRIRYEMPRELKAEHVSAISREFREADGTRGMRLRNLNDSEVGTATGGSAK